MPLFRRSPLLRAAALACVLGTCAAALHAADYPPRKPGLWEMKMGDGAGGANSPPAQTIQQCIDAATDQALRDMGQGMGKDACSKQEMRREGSTLVIDSVCRMGATTATSHAVVTGDFGSSYRMESSSTYKPPMMGKSSGSFVMEAKWVGPCKAGQKPGDMIMGNGMKMNVVDMMKGQPKK